MVHDAGDNRRCAGESPHFVDLKGFGCSAWRGYDCSADYGADYGAEDLLAVRTNCPLCCGSAASPAGLKVLASRTVT